MPGTKLILVDSDALVGLINSEDVHHQTCIRIANYLDQQDFTIITPYPIILEAANALSRNTKINRPDLASILLRKYSQPEVKSTMNENVAQIVADSFGKNTSRKNTPFDHYLLALAKKNSIRYVFSFDLFYKKQGLTPVEELLKK